MMKFFNWLFPQGDAVAALVKKRRNAMQVLVTLALEQGGGFEYVLPDCTYKGKNVGSWTVSVTKLNKGKIHEHDRRS